MSYSLLICLPLSYGVAAWIYKFDIINQLQKKVVQFISISKCNDHTEPLFKILN